MTIAGKNTLIVILTFILLAGLFSNVYSNKNDYKSKLSINPLGQSGTSKKISKLTIDPSAKKSIQKMYDIFEVNKPVVTKESVEINAKKIGIDGAAVDDGIGIGIKLADGKKYLVDKETGSTMFTTKEFEEQVTSLVNVLSDAEYRKLAETFLEKSGLAEANSEFYDINRNNVLGSTQKPFFIEARFRHKPIDGVEITGVGPRLSVLFGENGKIIGFMSEWREAKSKPIKKLPIISIEEALSKIEKGDGLLLTDGECDNDGRVTDIQIVYNSDPIGYKQKYFVPYFQLEGISGKGKFGAKILALSEDDYAITDPVER